MRELNDVVGRCHEATLQLTLCYGEPAQMSKAERDAYDCIHAARDEIEQLRVALNEGSAIKEIKRLESEKNWWKKLAIEHGDEIRGLKAEIERLRAIENAYHRSDLDIEPCLHCSLPVVCLPDGMPLCEACAKTEATEGGGA